MSRFQMLCSLLPADVNWGDSITPDIVDHIVRAATPLDILDCLQDRPVESSKAILVKCVKQERITK